MATIPSQPSWYSGKKKPKLQIKILQEILNHGELSKVRFERQYQGIHYHADIVLGFQNLKKHELIEESDKRIRRGKLEILYALSTKGILALISENPQPDYFWKILVSWCSSSKTPDAYTLDNVYRLFMTMFVGNTFANSVFSAQLNFFDRLLIRWFDGNIKLSGSVISSSQIVLECLATNKELTFENLQHTCHLSKHSLSVVLDKLTIKKNYSSMYYLDDSDFYDLDKRTEEYVDFMIHCLVSVVKKRKRIVSYQLSLIGIMLVLALIRCSKMDLSELSQHFQTEFKKPINLSCSLPIQSYYDKIASAHKHKLPLIFGIWPSLKNILGINLVYSLDSIIDKNSRAEAVESPLFLGGIREVYNDVEGIIMFKRSKLVDVYDEGFKLLTRIYNEKNHKQIKRLEPVYQKFTEIELLLKYSYISSFLDSLSNENYSSKYDWQLIYNNHTNFIISSLKEEVSLLFYLILGKSRSEILLPPISNQHSLQFIPREGLRKILKEHTLVKDKFNSWIKEIREYHYSTSHLIDKFLALERQVLEPY